VSYAHLVMHVRRSAFSVACGQRPAAPCFADLIRLNDCEPSCLAPSPATQNHLPSAASWRRRDTSSNPAKRLLSVRVDVRSRQAHSHQHPYFGTCVTCSQHALDASAACQQSRSVDMHITRIHPSPGLRPGNGGCAMVHF